MKNQNPDNLSNDPSAEEIDNKLDKVLSESIKAPTKEELDYIESLDGIFKEQNKKGKCLTWRCPICGKLINEITSIGQFKDLLAGFQRHTFYTCQNNHRNWFYLKGGTIIFQAEVGVDDIKERGEKWFSLTKEKWGKIKKRY